MGKCRNFFCCCCTDVEHLREIEEWNKQRLRERLTRFYKRYSADKIGVIERLVEEYGNGREDALMSSLTKKWGPEPIPFDELLKASSENTTEAQLFCDRKPYWLDRLSQRIFSLLAFPGGRLVVGGNPNGEVQVIHPENGEVEATLRGHNDSVLAIILTPHGLFTGSADCTIRLWNLKTLASEQTYVGHEGIVMALGFGSSCAAIGLFSASEDRCVFQWNVAAGSCVHQFKPQNSAIVCMNVSASHIFTGNKDGEICIYEIAKRNLVLKLEEAHYFGVRSLAIDEGGILFSGGGDGTIKVWKDVLEAEAPSSIVTGHNGAVTALLAYDEELFSTGSDSNVVCWDISVEGEIHPKEVMHTFDGFRCVSDETNHVLALSNNELITGGQNKVINKFNVSDLLTQEMDFVPLRPLSNAVGHDMEEKLKAMPTRERHWYFASLEENEAIRRYTELPINFVVDTLNYKVQSSWTLREFFAFVPFLILFLGFILWESDTKSIYYMNVATSGTLDGNEIGLFKTDRNFVMVTNPQWWGTWVTEMIIPSIFGDKNATSAYEPLRFNGQNQFIGALRFRTQRSAGTSCEVNEYILEGLDNFVYNESAPNRGCFGHYDFNSAGGFQKDFACFFEEDCEHNSSALSDPNTFNFSSGKFEFNDDAGTAYQGLQLYRWGGYVVDIPVTKSFEEAAHMATTMIQNGFIDDTATRFVATEFFLYNADIGVFVANKFVAEVYPGGGWYTSVQHIPFRVFDPASSIFRIVFECFIFVYVLFWLYSYVLDGVRYYKLNGIIWGFFFDPWALIDLTSVVLFCVMFGLRWQWFHKSTLVPTKMPFQSYVYPQNLESIVSYYQAQRYVAALCMIITFIRILKYIRLNDQLNILTKTLAAAQSAIIGVLLLFLYFVFAFSLAGMAMYGTNNFRWRTLDGAFNTLLRILLGDMDYDAMSETHRAATPVFFWAYLIFANFLLLNFVIAVLSDAFNDVCENRLPLPLDKAIIRVATGVAQSLLPGALRITVELLRSGSSRTALTAEQAILMRKYRDSLLSEEALHFKDYDELDYFYVSRSFFVKNVPEEMKSDENLNFMAEVYNDLAWDYHWRLKDKSNDERHEQEGLVEEVLLGEFSMFKQAQRDFDELFTALQGLHRSLRHTKPDGGKATQCT